MCNKTALAVLAFLCSIFQFASAQNTQQAIYAGFGIDGDLRANEFQNSSLPINDDWFHKDAGIGAQIIDTTGAKAIVAGYASQPSTLNRSFSRLMKQMPFSVVNGKLLLDAVFHRDFHGDDSTVFASGSNKNSMNPAEWSCPISQQIPSKNEILDVFAHVRRDGSELTDSLWMFGGISLDNPVGSRYFDFELMQTDLYYDPSVQRFLNVGPDSGHTAWKFDASGNILTAGDIIFSAEFSSAALTKLEARIWINRSDLSITPTAFDWGGLFDGATNSSVFGYASIQPKSSGQYYGGYLSPGNTWAGPFALVLKNNSVVPEYTPKQFMEIAVNLSKLGLDPAAYSINICNSPFRRVLVKSRASASFSSELKDFVAPLRMFKNEKVNAYAPITYYCGSMPQVNIDVLNPNYNSLYTWQTNTGHIVGNATGTGIIIDQPGTYYVSQQFNSQCYEESRDTVIVFFDSVCRVLDVALIGFSGEKSESGTELHWDVENNHLVKNFGLEQSLDGKNFKLIANISPNNQTHEANYTFRHRDNFAGNAVFYRLRINGWNGAVKYSRIVRINVSGNNELQVFPNPSQGDFTAKIYVQSAQMGTVSILDNKGNRLVQKKINLRKGENNIPFDQLMRHPGGVYYIQLSTENGVVTKSMMIQSSK